MTNLLAIFAFLVLGGFLLILAVEVPSPDLIAVATLTIVLAGIDFYRSVRDPNR
ncbi:MAG: hypothetical protein KJO42_15565 [Silicimonas sp.]|nr:hypothetical protein [Silicimonas sp.]NND19569.1 hypothetical protein [Silicimonas sp.]NND20949.1 hypothetical protein [Silicimonas sp.]NND40554.1 hypothetical protein [Silicimonas sp.]NNF91576.1 hypothetical protein [Boseongicola sp.]